MIKAFAIFLTIFGCQLSLFAGEPQEVEIQEVNNLTVSNKRIGSDPMWGNKGKTVAIASFGSNGQKYVIYFPHATSMELVRDYLKEVKIYYLDNTKITKWLEGYYMFTYEKPEGWSHEFYMLDDEQKKAVTTTYMSQADLELPLIGQTIGSVMSFVYSKQQVKN
ncbi:MAG: hypothetical protein HON90_06105 [Halobacteriovoraceae bacterium]|jgi:hypothetical protein|nr:hypothetical protein [Halobacteriovoraceae bacterium]